MLPMPILTSKNKWLPASHIPVVNESYLKANEPDYVIILPWNLKSEITQQTFPISGRGVVSL